MSGKPRRVVVAHKIIFEKIKTLNFRLNIFNLPNYVKRDKKKYNGINNIWCDRLNFKTRKGKNY